MHSHDLRIFTLGGAALLVLLTGGCVKHVKDVTLLDVTRVSRAYPATPELRVRFSSRSDFRALNGKHAYLWASLCPIKDGIIVNVRDVYLNGKVLTPGHEDMPKRVADDEPALHYSSYIDYDKVSLEVDPDVANYNLLLPPDAVNLCFRVESAGWWRFRTNDVEIPKATIAGALAAPPVPR